MAMSQIKDYKSKARKVFCVCLERSNEQKSTRVIVLEPRLN